MRRILRPATQLFVAIAATLVAGSSSAQTRAKIAPAAATRAALPTGSSRVIVMAPDSASLPSVAAAVRQVRGIVGRMLPIINAYAADLPNAAIERIASNPFVSRIALDRPITAAMERTGATVGATAVRENFGYDGTGIGVAVIDSGVTSWHDDLAGGSGGQRVDRFVDLVNGRTTAYDDYGHGTHVAGIIAGNGFDSGGARSGIAPNARITALKVLDASGNGRISDVIAALDYAVANRFELNIRVINLSVATGVYESYEVDPLTIAAKRAVEAGIVVVAAAGNFGKNSDGRFVYGGVTAPGNAPWVLTVGASSHMGTVDRTDDTMAAFSSHGPTAVDNAAKPDIVAPGVGIESLSDPASTFYTTQARFLLDGTVPTAYRPYLSQSGTSMASPVVAGTVALMLQANPALTPNAVKAILQYTAQIYQQYDPLTQGAGFLNARGAVRLARFLASPSGEYPGSSLWSNRLFWGNRMVWGGLLTPGATAWSTDVVWGSDTTPGGQAVSWGVICTGTNCDDGGGDWSRWRITCTDAACGDSSWSNGTSANVVWGARCGGFDCQETWSPSLFGTSDSGDTVVWGTSDQGDTVVWGTGDGSGDTVVWGTSCTDVSCVPVIWQP